MGYLRYLDDYLDDTIADLQLPNDAKLVLVGQRSFSWSSKLSNSVRIKLSNNNMTATNFSHDDFDGAYGNIAISSDTHYWEIKVQ